MAELTANINWLAVIVGAIVAFIVGWLWYSPMLFGKKWAEGVGVTLDSANKMPINAMMFQALGTFLLSWVVGVTAASNALATIFLILITIVVLQISGGYFTKKSGYAIATDAGFILVMGIIMIAAQGIF